MELTKKEKNVLLSLLDASIAEVGENMHLVNQQAVEELAEDEYRELLKSLRKKLASMHGTH